LKTLPELGMECHPIEVSDQLCCGIRLTSKYAASWTSSDLFRRRRQRIPVDWLGYHHLMNTMPEVA
jgi:hypothetical protein